MNVVHNFITPESNSSIWKQTGLRGLVLRAQLFRKHEQLTKRNNRPKISVVYTINWYTMSSNWYAMSSNWYTMFINRFAMFSNWYTMFINLYAMSSNWYTMSRNGYVPLPSNKKYPWDNYWCYLVTRSLTWRAVRMPGVNSLKLHNWMSHPNVSLKRIFLFNANLLYRWIFGAMWMPGATSFCAGHWYWLGNWKLRVKNCPRSESVTNKRKTGKWRLLAGFNCRLTTVFQNMQGHDWQNNYNFAEKVGSKHVCEL